MGSAYQKISSVWRDGTLEASTRHCWRAAFVLADHGRCVGKFGGPGAFRLLVGSHTGMMGDND